jgi:hypothetical protein
MYLYMDTAAKFPSSPLYSNSRYSSTNRVICPTTVTFYSPPSSKAHSRPNLGGVMEEMWHACNKTQINFPHGPNALEA